MSEASEWCDRYGDSEKTRPRLEIKGEAGDLDLQVDSTAAGVRLYIPSRGWFTPEDAIKAARWILDTFGDGP